MVSPFNVEVYDRTFKFLGLANGYEALRVVVAHNAKSTAEVTYALDHPRLVDLMEHGTRVVVRYHGAYLLGGPITTRSGEGPLLASSVTFGVEGDFGLLDGILGWPNPLGNIYQQGEDPGNDYEGTHDTFVGPAESAVKHFVGANAARLGYSWLTIAPDQGRGSVVDIKMRMNPLTDKLLPAVDDAGIGISIVQQGAGLVLDCYVPTTRAVKLSETSGPVVGWSWSEKAPTVTRVIIGGQGEAEDRDFQLLVAAQTEAEWKMVRESFRDARDVELGNYPLLLKRGQESLDEGAAKSGLNLTLAETEFFRYGVAAVVGDRLSATVAAGLTINDVLRSCSLSHTAGDGVLVEPQVGGGKETNDTLLARAISAVARSVRDLKSGR